MKVMRRHLPTLILIFIVSCGGGGSPKNGDEEVSQGQGSDVIYVTIVNGGLSCDEEITDERVNQFTLENNGIEVISSWCYFSSYGYSEDSNCSMTKQELIHEIYLGDLIDAEILGYQQLEGTYLEYAMWRVDLVESQCD